MCIRDSIIRIGKHVDGKLRPLKIVLDSEEEKFKLMGNLPALQGIERYKGVSITEDIILDERKTFKELSQTAKQTNQGNAEADYLWRVRGSSKNGFHLQKIQKDGRSKGTMQHPSS